MEKYSMRFMNIIFVVLTTSSCKTYNTILHNGPQKNVPQVWDLDEPVKMGFFLGSVVPLNLKKKCGPKNWETVKIYLHFLEGWKIAVKCQS